MFTGIFIQGTFGSMTKLTVAILGIFATFLTVIYTFFPARRIFFGPVKANLKDVKEAPISMIVPLLALVLVSFLFGIYPNFIMDFLNIFSGLLPMSV